MRFFRSVGRLCREPQENNCQGSPEGKEKIKAGDELSSPKAQKGKDVRSDIPSIDIHDQQAFECNCRSFNRAKLKHCNGNTASEN